jgi:hypothetical protein
MAISDTEEFVFVKIAKLASLLATLSMITASSKISVVYIVLKIKYTAVDVL